ncbi:hypothetical protein K2Y00_03545 [Patescibacteria group bacterium]|nr:hypothetical protein [Patescibacteria group bacterium]
MNDVSLKQYVILTIAILVIGGILFGSRFFGPQYDPQDEAYNASYWSYSIQRSGAPSAYQEFLVRNSSTDSTRQHLAAHVFGEVLFKIEGEEGISVCDAQFGFGCYHGFFGRAISEGGVESIARLDAACVKTHGTLGTGCQHGVGHGILEYVGYDALDEALALCAETTQLTSRLGCTSGVFMEYNSPLAGISDGLVPTTRALDPLNLYEPCNEVEEKYKESCFHELGAWVLSHHADAARAGFCEGIEGRGRESCFVGMGSAIAHKVGPYPTQGIEMCAMFGENDMRSCRAGLSWGFFTVPETRLHALEACGYTEETQKNACLRLGDLTEGLDPTFPS